MGARAVGPWVDEQKPLGESPLRGNPSPESTYLPTLPFLRRWVVGPLSPLLPVSTSSRSSFILEEASPSKSFRKVSTQDPPGGVSR